MKKVFEQKHDIAHLWAHQRQDEARQGGRMLRLFFEGKTIYSYGRHFPIATIHSRNGEPAVVLFTNRKYSNTTSEHVRTAWAACSHYRRIICKNPIEASEGRHRSNIEAWEDEAKTIALGPLAKAKKPEIYLSEIANLRREAIEYAEYFNLSLDSESLTYLWIESKEAGTKLNEEEKRKLEEYRKRQEEERIARNKKYLSLFRRFKNVRAYGTEWSYLRYNKAEDRIETSQGIQMGRLAATRAFALLSDILSKGGKSPISSPIGDVMGYDIIEVGPKYVRIGCHKIEWKEIKAVAKKAGIK